MRSAPRQRKRVDSGVIRVLLIGCGDVALRTADLLRPAPASTASPAAPRTSAKLRAARHRPDRRRPRPARDARPPARGAVRGAALRAAAVRRPRRSADAQADRRAGEGAKHTTALRLHLDVGRLRRLRRRARRRDASAPRADAARAASRRRRGPAARLGAAATASRCRSCARRASTPRRACRSTASGRARRCWCPTTTCSPTTSTPTTSRARPSPRCSAAGRNRAYNVTDDAEMKMGGWFDLVADAFHLPRPPRVTGRRPSSGSRRCCCRS